MGMDTTQWRNQQTPNSGIDMQIQAHSLCSLSVSGLSLILIPLSHTPKTKILKPTLRKQRIVSTQTSTYPHATSHVSSIISQIHAHIFAISRTTLTQSVGSLRETQRTTSNMGICFPRWLPALFTVMLVTYFCLWYTYIMLYFPGRFRIRPSSPSYSFARSITHALAPHLKKMGFDLLMSAPSGGHGGGAWERDVPDLTVLGGFWALASLMLYSYFGVMFVDPGCTSKVKKKQTRNKHRFTRQPATGYGLSK